MLALGALGDDAAGVFEFLCDTGDFALGDELVKYAVDNIGDLGLISMTYKEALEYISPLQTQSCRHRRGRRG